MHTIHLRDPWQHEPTKDGTRWLRSFHRPTGLTDGVTVWLVISGPSTAVSLNGQQLSASSDEAAARFDVTSMLTERNRMAIVVEGETASAGGRAFDVWLEIDG